uniref:WD_REPEATS_REGION domain-containing protein n=1 Tax=Bursaphelenchus xylophilus TaxID=6326 RepID=A0A1I7SBV7_BURXY
MFRGGSKSRAKSPKPPEKKKSVAKKASSSSAPAENGVAAPEVELRSHHFAFVFPSFEEFPLEFDVIRAVINDMQQYLFEYDMDLECSTFISESSHQMAEYSHLLGLLKEPRTTVVCFIGDKYGDPQMPLEIDNAEFGCLRTAAVEACKDAKLLEQYYVQSKPSSSYFLNVRQPRAEMDKLAAVVRKASQRALEDGTLVSGNGEKSMGLQFQTSFIDKVAQKVMEDPSRHLFVLRRFKDLEAKSADNIWKDYDVPRFEKVTNLKNKIAEKLPKEAYISHVLNTKMTDPSRWLTGKDAGVYERQLTMDLINALKTRINVMPKLDTNHLVTDSEMAARDHKVHSDYLKQVAAKEWISRAEIDQKLAEFAKKGMEKPICALIHGPPGSGKSATIARLHEQLTEQGCYVITRFTQLTDCSMYANELIKGAFLTLCQLAGIDPNPISASFTLATTISQAKLLLEKVDKPVFLLLDNANHLKFGRSLSEIEKPLKKLLPKMSIIYTANSADAQIDCFPMAEEFLALEPIAGEQCLEILKSEMKAAYGVVPENMNMLQQMHKTDSLDPILGRLQAKELMEVSPILFSRIDQYLQKLEEQYDPQTVRIICQMLAVSPFGLTSAEISDGVRLANFQNGMVTKAQNLFSAMPMMVFRRLAQLCVPIQIEDRVAYRIRHPINAVLIRQKYMQTATELVKTNEIMSELFKTGPSLENGRPNAQSAGIVNYPPAITKDTRSLRRLRYSWYYLLHSANIDELKSEALCAFEYIEGVFQFFGLTRLLTVFEECLQQVLHHDLLVLFEQILLPAIPTLIHDGNQFVSEFINRLRYRRAMNSEYLNELIEQAMLWTDFYTNGSLLVPMTCWINPPKMKQVVSFEVPFQATKPILHPTCNHQHLLIAGDNADLGAIYMYHIASQILFKTFRAHTDRVTSFQTSSDGTFFTSTSHDASVRVWSILNLECSKTIKSPTKILCSAMAEDDRRLIIGCSDSTARIIDLETGKVIKSFPEHIGPVVDLKLMSKDELLVTGSGDFAVMVWDLNTGQISDDNSFLLAACGSRMHMWDVNSIENEPMVNSAASLICMKLAPDERTAACGTEDGVLAVWDLDGCRCLWTTSQQKSGAVTAVEFTVDSMFIVSGSAQGSITMWETSSGQLTKQFDLHNDAIVEIVCFTDGNNVLTVDRNDAAFIWSISSSEDPSQIEILSSFTALRAPVYVRLEDSIVISYNTQNLKELNVWSQYDAVLTLKTKAHHTEDITCYHANRTGTTFVTGSADQSLKVWRLETGFLTQVLVGHEGVVLCCYCSHDGKTVASGGKDKLGFVWDAQTGQSRLQYTAKGAITCIQLTHDASIVISGDEAGWIEAYYVRTQQRLSSFNAHRAVEGLVVSMEAHRILAKLANTAQMPILCLHNTPAGQYSRNGNDETMSLSNLQRPRPSIADSERPATTVVNVMEIRHDTVVSNGSNPSKGSDKTGRKSNVSEKSQPSTVSASGDTRTSNNTTVAKKSRTCAIV